MNTQKVEGSELVEAQATVELIDCGQASEHTKGEFSAEFGEFAEAPFWGFIE